MVRSFPPAHLRAPRFYDGNQACFPLGLLGRYLVLTVNLAAAVVMARLLTPDEYGVSVLGGALFAVAESIRALGGGAYLIQKKELTSDDVRSSLPSASR